MSPYQSGRTKTWLKTKCFTGSVVGVLPECSFRLAMIIVEVVKLGIPISLCRLF
jgi:hypothetical protein